MNASPPSDRSCFGLPIYVVLPSVFLIYVHPPTSRFQATDQAGPDATDFSLEIVVRRAVGATRNAILMQFLIEAIVIASIGGLVGLALCAPIIGVTRIATPGLEE
jgi:hypothetical protein